MLRFIKIISDLHNNVSELLNICGILCDNQINMQNQIDELKKQVENMIGDNR